MLGLSPPHKHSDAAPSWLGLRGTLITVAVVWTLIIAGLGVWNGVAQMDEFERGLIREASGHLRAEQRLRRQVGGHGGIYVGVSADTPPNPFLSHVPHRDIDVGGRQLTLMDPAYVVDRQSGAEAADQPTVRATSLTPLGPDNAPDPWERRALESFRSGTTEVTARVERDGESYLRLMRPMLVDPPCLQCHKQQGYKVGDVRGGISVSLPVKVPLARTQRAIEVQSVALGLVWLVGLMGLALITQRQVRDKRARLRVAHLLRQTVEDFPDGVLIVDRHRSIVLANAAARRHMGSELQEIDSPSSASQQAHPLAVIDQVFADGVPVSMDFVHDGSDDSGLAVTIEVHAAPVFDSAGRIVRVVETQRDVSARRDMERRLETSEGRARAVLEALPDLIFVFDRDGVLLDYHSSPSGLYTAPDVGIIGRRSVELLPPEVGLLLEDMIERTLSTGEMQTEEYELAIPGAGVSDYEARMVASGTDEVVTIVRNVSARKAAECAKLTLERQTQHAHKLESLEVLAGGIAHDFNNLLMVMLGNLDLALEETARTSLVHEYLMETERAAGRAAELSKQMLAYSGRGHFVLEPLDIGALVKATLEAQSASLPAGVVVETHLGQALPQVHGDAAQLRQVVTNLIENAWESLETEGGTIALTVCTEVCSDSLPGSPSGRLVAPVDAQLGSGTYLVIEVRDTGCGMDSETLRRVFEPFFTTRFQGRGLGMAAVLGIVRGHHGAIELSSEVGTGSVARVYLPAVKVPHGEVVDTDDDETWRGSGRVLVVDDEEVVLAVASKMLVRLGFDVEEAVNGRDAVDRFARQPQAFACVVLDLTMPGLGGLAAFREIRQIRGDIPVLLCSGYSEEEAMGEASTGPSPDGFLKKPYVVGALQRALREVLNMPAGESA